jgi:hypothetical protein
MRRIATRGLPRLAPVTTFLAAVAACAATAEDSERALSQALKSSRQAQAVRHAIGMRPVRWISRHELCVVPYDAPNVDECRARPLRQVAESQLEAIRAAVPDSTGTSDFVACVKVSREIALGDSSLVVVGTLGGIVVDDLAESRSHKVWFRPATNRDSIWVAPHSDVVSSDIAPIRDASGC